MKSYHDQNYPHEQPVTVTFDDGDSFKDAIKGLNQGHALWRGRQNWDGAAIEPRQWDEDEERAVNRTNGRLDKAVVAYRENPTEANREALMAVMREHNEVFMQEQTTDYIARTS